MTEIEPLQQYVFVNTRLAAFRPEALAAPASVPRARAVKRKCVEACRSNLSQVIGWLDGRHCASHQAWHKGWCAQFDKQRRKRREAANALECEDPEMKTLGVFLSKRFPRSGRRVYTSLLGRQSTEET